MVDLKIPVVAVMLNLYRNSTVFECLRVANNDKIPVLKFWADLDKEGACPRICRIATRILPTMAP